MRNVLRTIAVAAVLAACTTAEAVDTRPLTARLERLTDAGVQRSRGLVASLDTAVARLTAKGADAAALSAAARTRAQLQILASRTQSSLDRSRTALARKFTTGEDADAVRAVLAFTAARLEARIEQHLQQCLDDVDALLAEAGLASE